MSKHTSVLLKRQQHLIDVLGEEIRCLKQMYREERRLTKRLARRVSEQEEMLEQLEDAYQYDMNEAANALEHMCDRLHNPLFSTN